MKPEPAWRVQLRVLFALIMREMATRYGRSAGGYVWAVLEPAGTVLILSLVFSYIARRPALGDSFPMFFATGYMAFHFYVDISRNVSQAVTFNKPLLTFPRVTILDTILSRFLLHLMTAAFVSTVILGALAAYTGERLVLDFSAVLTAVALAALLGVAVGAMNCALFVFSDAYQRIFNILNRPLFLISGVFFIYESLPRALQEVIWWNPLLHVTALMRRGFYPGYDAAFVSAAYVVFFAVPPLLLAVLMLPVVRARMLEP